MTRCSPPEAECDFGQGGNSQEETIAEDLAFAGASIDQEAAQSDPCTPT